MKPKPTKYMVRSQATSYTSKKYDTYDDALAEAKHLCTTSKSFDKFEVLQVVAVVSPSVTPNVEEFYL